MAAAVWDILHECALVAGDAGMRVAGLGMAGVRRRCGMGCEWPGTCSTSMKSRPMGIRDLPEDLVSFPASFPIDSAYEKLERQNTDCIM